MANKSEPPNVDKIASKAIWIGEVETPDEPPRSKRR
jgi:hypothetical protein